MAYLEHANITVKNPDEIAQCFANLFGWKVRWSGASKDNGYTVHVGNQECYVALYTNDKLGKNCGNANHAGHLNHIGVVVEDLDAAISLAKRAGLEPFDFGEYEPGRRFYFMLEDTLEIEIISYK